MGLNIIHTNSFQFENRNSMRNTAKDILKRQGESERSAEKIIDEKIFNTKSENIQLEMIKASYQMNLDDSLKETLRYLKQHSTRKSEKKPVLGEIWDLFSKKETNEYTGELSDFVIDEDAKNIFAA